MMISLIFYNRVGCEPWNDILTHPFAWRPRHAKSNAGDSMWTLFQSLVMFAIEAAGIY
jgi:hypothetical protein